MNSREPLPGLAGWLATRQLAERRDTLSRVVATVCADACKVPPDFLWWSLLRSAMAFGVTQGWISRDAFVESYEIGNDNDGWEASRGR